MVRKFITGGAKLGAVLTVFSLAIWPSAFGGTPAAASTLKLLVYNTHGLPALLACDRPSQRFPKIAKLAAPYDLSLLQEDFAHHHLLLDHLDDPTSVTRGARPDAPPCLLCSGSGLTMVSNLSDQDWTLSTRFYAFGTCSGLLSGANDCFAQKGFQLTFMDSKQGKRIVVVNTHLDAGRNKSDRTARAFQLGEIATVLEREASDQALIIAGDLNLDWDSPDDRAVLKAFRDRLGLQRAGDGVQADRGWVVLDYVYFRSGAQVTLDVLTAGEDLAFKDQAGPLSDHPALFTTFRIQ